MNGIQEVSGSIPLISTKSLEFVRSVLIKKFLYSGVNGVMCYGISRCFSCCDFLGQWNFPYEVIVNVDLLSAVSAGLVRRKNDDFSTSS